MKKKLYFAHCILDYGNEIEQKSIDVIKSFGFDVENPNQPHHQDQYNKKKMKYYLEEIIPSCNGLVYLPSERGITSGVYQEITKAILIGMPVYRITRTGIFDNVENIDYEDNDEILTYEETLDYIREVMPLR